MVAKIVAVSQVRGILATYWEVDFLIEAERGAPAEHSVSVDEAISLANRDELGPVAIMCRSIGSTPVTRLGELVGQCYTSVN